MNRIPVRQRDSHHPLSYHVVAGALVFSFLASATAFSLLGPYAPWMTPQVGLAEPGDIGGPMNLGEEYRWNVPVLTYAFDQSFLNYFGSNGVAAVESAIQVLNALPPVSQDSPTNYPLQTLFMNWRAQAEGLFDLKSQALSSLLEQLGLATPTRFIDCVRSFVIVSGEPQVTIVQLNYDPYSRSTSTQLNGVTYNYQLVYGQGNPPGSVDAVEYPVDPLSTPSPAVADAALNHGSLYSGLTRDDAAGLRYLIHTNNRNFEALLPDVHGSGTNAGGYVNQAIRGGVDKILFVRPAYDPLSGQFFTPYTNEFIDTYITNGALHQQQLERVVTQPDILFSSAGLSDGTWVTARVARTGTTNWLSSASPGANGPGLIRPQVQIAFHRPDFQLYTSDSPTDGAVNIEPFDDYGWGSFDNSSNAPVVYPAGPTPPMTNQFNVQLELSSAGVGMLGLFSWQLPVAPGGQANVQTSTNLVDWQTLLTLINHGSPVSWHHQVIHSQRYFRVVGQ